MAIFSCRSKEIQRIEAVVLRPILPKGDLQYCLSSRKFLDGILIAHSWQTCGIRSWMIGEL